MAAKRADNATTEAVRTTRASAPPQPVRPLPGDGLAGPYVPRDYRTWMTGQVHDTTTLMLQEPLPPPTVHDTPSPVLTYTGAECTVKACDGHRERFKPSGLCTRCWTRARKVTRGEEVA